MIGEIKELTTLLTGLDLVKVYEGREAADIWTEDALISTVKSHLRCRTKEIDTVAWFHLTRTVQNLTFVDGILALGSNLNSIWKMLIAIPGDPDRSLNLSTVREIGVPDHHYQMKTTSPVHFGSRLSVKIA